MATSNYQSSGTMRITTRSDTSTPISVLQKIIKPFRPHLIKSNKTLPGGSQQLTPHSKAEKKCHITAHQVQGIWIYDMVAKAPSASGEKQSKKKHIYYFAGGGWTMPPSPEHWKLCTEFAETLENCVVSIVSYPLAPNSPARESLSALEKLYPHLFSSGEEEEVIFAGDSAGGNVALSLVLHVLGTNKTAPAPSKLLLICPAVDLRPQPQNNESFTSELQDADHNDPLLGVPFTNQTAATWAADLDPSSPLVTPLLADVDVLRDRGVKVFGVTAGKDVLAPPAQAFAERLKEAGVEGEWLHWDGVMHCFVLAGVYGIKEGKEGTAWCMKVLEQ